MRVVVEGGGMWFSEVFFGVLVLVLTCLVTRTSVCICRAGMISYDPEIL